MSGHKKTISIAWDCCVINGKSKKLIKIYLLLLAQSYARLSA